MHLETFITSALLILIVTSVAVSLSKYLGLGSILGLLVSGIIVGPYSPGPYATMHVEDVRRFTELGIILLLFLIGLEMKPGRLWAMRRYVLGLGSLQILITGMIIGAYFSLYQDNWQGALLIGLTFALSSTAFVLQLLQERGEIASAQGTAAFSILLMQDIAIIPLLAVIPIISDTGTLSAEVPLWEQIVIVLGMLTLIAVFGRYLLSLILDQLARRRNKEGFLLVVLLAVFLSAWAMHQAGVSMALGAFFMGMMMSDSRYRLQIQAAIEPYKGMLMSLFFVAVGMSIDLHELGQQASLFAQHTVVIVIIKFSVLFLLAMTFGYPRWLAARLSLLLAQGGEFGFVLFGSAKLLQVIDDATFALAVGVISITMLATPILVRIGDLVTVAPIREKQKPAGSYDMDGQQAENRVIIGGYGRVGHTVATLLRSSGIPLIAFDVNPAQVEQGRKDGLPVYFGDISDPELLSAAHAEQAALVVMTVDQSPAALKAVAHIRSSYPRLPVISRARDLEDCGRLLEAGATHAFPEAIESSLRLGGLALELINVPQENVDLLLQGVRSANYRLLDTGEPAQRDPE